MFISLLEGAKLKSVAKLGEGHTRIFPQSVYAASFELCNSINPIIINSLFPVLISRCQQEIWNAGKDEIRRQCVLCPTPREPV